MHTLVYLLAQIKPPSTLPRADFAHSLASFLRVAFAAMAMLSVAFVAFGGLKYTMSNGDPQGTAKAKDTILYALIGLVVGVSAFTIVGFVLGRLG